MSDSELRIGEVAVGLPAQADAALYFIGTIRTPWKTRQECPKRGSPDGPVCSIVLDEHWRQGLTGPAGHKRIPGVVLDEPGAPRPGTADAIPAADDGYFRAALAGAAEPDRILAR
jgi:hypothetical protein